MQFIILICLMLVACASRPEKHSSNDQPKQVASISSRYTTLAFGPGSTKLTRLNKSALNELAREVAGEGREINEVRVLAWADKEYAEAKRRLKSDERLAKRRAEVVEEYLRHELSTTERIETINMAKGHEKLDQEDNDTKEAMDDVGVTSSVLPNGEISYTKASKAIVIIDYKD
jgi:outer membrane protein OmpA-like peptidoglycan-associated protein